MASKDPKHYQTPEAVLIDPKLDRAAKAEVLRQWKLDLELELNASDENMPVMKTDGNAKPGVDANLSELLRRVTDNLRKVDPPAPDTEPGANPHSS